MQLALCDDDERELYALLSSLEQALKLMGKTAVISCFQSGTELIHHIKMNQIEYSLVFLDIFLPDLNGTELAEQLQADSPETEIAFVTTSREHAVEAFSLQALHYLVKPVSVEQMREALARLLDRQNLRESIAVKVGRDTLHIYLDSILYAQSENKATVVYLSVQHDPLRTAYSFRDFEVMLETGPFLRIQRGFLVNMHFVERMTSDSCILKNGQTLLISRKERKEIRVKYKEFIFSQLSMNQLKTGRGGER